MATRKRNDKTKLIGFIIAAVVLLLTGGITVEQLLGGNFIPSWSELSEDVIKSNSPVSVHYIDVGQGDCELIKTPGENILIDCGERENSSKVINYLNAQKIERLDYIFVTHPHSDHMGGMSEIIEAFDVGTVYMPEIKQDLTPTTSSYLNLLSAMKENKVKTKYAEKGDYIKLSDDCRIDILAPVKNDYDNLNNYSVVLKFTHEQNTFLFTGDIEKEAEYDILDSGSDVSAGVLKVAHHGSYTSTYKKFFNAVSPRFAVIGVGADNSYGHPDERILERLVSRCDDIFRTDLNGNIIFESDGKTLNVLVKKGG